MTPNALCLQYLLPFSPVSRGLSPNQPPTVNPDVITYHYVIGHLGIEPGTMGIKPGTGTCTWINPPSLPRLKYLKTFAMLLLLVYWNSMLHLLGLLIVFVYRMMVVVNNPLNSLVQNRFTVSMSPRSCMLPLSFPKPERQQQRGLGTH